MIEHDERASMLKQRLKDFTAKDDKDWIVSREKHIDPPVTPGTRRIDVAVETNQPHQRGYGFEMKTTSSSRHFVFGQLRDYLMAGFRPVLIGPDSFLQSSLPTEPRVPLDWATDSLYTSFVTFDGTSQLEFQLVDDRLPPDDDLRSFFQS